MTQSVRDFLKKSASAKYPAFMFATVGDKIIGRIINTPHVLAVKTDDGSMEDKVIIEIEAAEGTVGTMGTRKEHAVVKAGDNVTVWVKAGKLGAALNEAVEKANVEGLAEGDTLAVQFVEERDTGKMQAAKVFAAELRPAKPRVAIGSLLGDD